MVNKETNPRLIIMGASGHGKVVADIAVQNGYRDIVFLDDDENVKECGGYPVIGKNFDIISLDGLLFVAIGNTAIRKQLMSENNKREFPILIHPSAVIADNVEIGNGSVIMAGSVVNPGVKIGKGCIINTSSSIDHDCVIGDFVHVAVGSRLCGSVTVGNCTWIGAGATIKNNIYICENCMIGAGATVVRNIDSKGIYIGVPAKEKGEKDKTDKITAIKYAGGGIFKG